MKFIATLSISVISLSCITARAASPDRPNVVFFLADDLGWSDEWTLFPIQPANRPNP